MTVTGLSNSAKGIWKVQNGTDTVYYVENDNGLYSVDSTSAPWGTEFIQVPYPPTVGRTVTTQGQTVSVEAEEDVKTVAGTFHCVKLKYTTDEPSLPGWIAWYGQGIGLVKYQGQDPDGTYHVLELRTYSLK